MSGAEISVDLSDLERFSQQLGQFAQMDNLGELFGLLATEGESQTRRRISVEKETPDGTPWQVWSDAYAATRHAGHSLLENQGELLDSLTSFADDESAVWGTNLIYAAAQQFGHNETVQVPSHQRTITQAFGKPLPNPKTINIDAYSFEQNIPARPYLGISDQNEQDLLAIGMEWLQQQLDDSFGGGNA